MVLVTLPSDQGADPHVCQARRSVRRLDSARGVNRLGEWPASCRCFCKLYLARNGERLGWRGWKTFTPRPSSPCWAVRQEYTMRKGASERDMIRAMMGTILAGWMALGSANGQPADTHPAFEVASVKVAGRPFGLALDTAG